MKKVLFLSEFFYPHWTGYAKASLKTALRLTEQGYKCAVLATQHDDALPLFEEYHGIAIFRAKPLIAISRTKYSLDSIIQFIRLVKNYDLIFINTPNSNGIFFSLIAKLAGKPTILFLHGDLIMPRGFKHRVLEAIFDVTMHLSCRLVDVVSTYTQDYAEHSRILKHHMRKFSPLLMPVEFHEKDADPEIEARLQRLRAEKGASALVGFAGRFVEEKAFDILLAAVPQVVRQIPGVHFVYAGDFPHYEDFFDRLKPLWEENAASLTHLGLLQGEAQMNAFYRHLDLYVLPSRSDCFGIVQVEAIEHRVPIVVTDIPGARWLVKQSGFGVLAAPENPDSLAAAIVTALKRGKSGFPGWEKAREITDKKNFFRQFAAIEGRLFPDVSPQE
jgi:glycosyltransferase involved in cell wall biosynthesis